MKHERHYSAPFALSAPSSHSMSLFLRGITLVSAISVLISCGNGAEVAPNQNTGGQQTARYTGPAAQGNTIAFKAQFWDPLTNSGRCISCHTEGGQASNYRFVDQTDVNLAYEAAITGSVGGQPLIDLIDPSNSRVVRKVAEGAGHNCFPKELCASEIQEYINNWAFGPATAVSGGLALMQQLTDGQPVLKDPGASLNFPDTGDTVGSNSNSFENTVYAYTRTNCVRCHSENGVEQQQAPFFASDSLASAYEAAKSKIDLDTPENSRFVRKLLQEPHNCPNPDPLPITTCVTDSGNIRDQIIAFANGLPLGSTPSGQISKAMKISDAILANGGSRYEADQIAIWKFTTGSGLTAVDSESIAPFAPMTLDLIDEVDWVTGYGLDFSRGGYAQATSDTSKKLAQLIQSSGDNAFSIEAWVIPGNVTQEDARIISYSANDRNRNFALSQTLYNYEFLHNSSTTDTEGRTSLITNNDDEDLQAVLQHVVATFDPIRGRRIYVNGVFTDDTDPADLDGDGTFGNLEDWLDSYSFTVGAEIDGSNHWSGKVRMVAVHKRALTAEQVAQNFSIGVGQKYFMLFSVADMLPTLPNGYVLFNVEQYDSYAYSFNQPVFVNLDDTYDATTPIRLQGMRIGINGREAASGQVFGHIDVNINSAGYDYASGGQLLSRLGTVIAVEKINNNISNDEFYLTFEELVLGAGGSPVLKDEPDPVAPALSDSPAVSDIGVKTFDEINASMSAITGIPVTDSTEVMVGNPPVAAPSVAATFASFEQQLPSIEDINAYLASHQMAVAQLAFSYCNVLVDNDSQAATPQFFVGFNFNQSASVAFNTQAKIDSLIDPLLRGLLNAAPPTDNLGSQPTIAEIKDVLSAQVLNPADPQPTLISHNNTTPLQYTGLIRTMQQCYGANPPGTPCTDNADRTISIAKAVCAATLGSALILIQ